MTPQQLLTRGGWGRTQAPGPDAEKREPRGSCRRGLEARAAARAVEVSPESGRHTPPQTGDPHPGPPGCRPRPARTTPRPPPGAASSGVTLGVTSAGHLLWAPPSAGSRRVLPHRHTCLCRPWLAAPRSPHPWRPAEALSLVTTVPVTRAARAPRERLRLAACEPLVGSSLIDSIHESLSRAPGK